MKKYLLLFFGLSLFIASLFFDKSILFLFTSFKNPVFDYISFFFSFTVVQIFFFFVVPCLIFWFKDRDSLIPFVLSFAAVSFITYSLKFLVLRPRPFLVLSFPLANYFSYNFFEFNSSFPSSHASTSFCSLAALKNFSKLWIVWLFFSLLVIFTRVYSGVHYLSDLIAGMLIGYSITHLIFLYSKRSRFVLKWKKILWK